MKRRIIVEHGGGKADRFTDELHLRDGVAFAGLPEGYQAGEGDPENGFDAWWCRSG